MNGAPQGSRTAGRKGHPARLSAEQLVQLAEVVETGPERAACGRPLRAPTAGTRLTLAVSSMNMYNAAIAYGAGNIRTCTPKILGTYGVALYC
jgi:hypothetical protein